MVDIYIIFKMIKEFIPAIILFTVGLITFIGIISQALKMERKTEYLSSIGFNRYLIDVASAGNRAWYGWERDETDERISERELEKLTLKELKKRFK